MRNGGKIENSSLPKFIEKRKSINLLLFPLLVNNTHNCVKIKILKMGGYNLKKAIFLLFILLLFPFLSNVDAHSGRTDSNGGHNCSEKSQAKGLCTGYHYHNGGGDSSNDSSSSSTSTSSNQPGDKNCTDFATYDEVVDYWNSKGYSKTNDPENLDGWGNVVDDGIPCEAPGDYDTTKIHGSPEQIAQQAAKKDNAIGEKDGNSIGYEDGYKGKEENAKATDGSEAYKSGYNIGYLKGFEEGNAKIESEKSVAEKEGYALGKKEDMIEMLPGYKNNKLLMNSFTVGFNRAVTERDKKKEDELNVLGYEDGLNDKNKEPKDVKESYLKAYQEGFSKGLDELKESYIDKGYQDAFIMLEYKKPDMNNDKYITWYQEGFEANTEVKKIKDMAYNMGLEGQALSIPDKYIESEEIMNHYYRIGAEEYKEQIRENSILSATVIGLMVLLWLSRRFYIVRKMVA